MPEPQRARRDHRSDPALPRRSRLRSVITTQPDADSDFYLALVEDDAEELYENAPCAYLSTLPDGTIIKANGTFLTWTGYSRESLLGRRRFQELLTRGDRIFYDTHMGPALAMQGRVREIAVDLCTADGGNLPVLVNSVLIKDEHGAPRVIRTAVFDARERRMYERELVAARERAEASEAKARALAATLQATFLPPSLLDIPGLDVGGGYRPAGDGSEVGGDFYDVFATVDGWGVVLGDVSGKGPEAASLTAVARYAVRAEATRSTTAADVLRSVHTALLAHDYERFCTAVYLDIVRDGDSHRITVASGGHHLPLAVDRSGAIRTVGEIGSILGVLDSVELHETTHVLEDDSMLVLFTDGVLEARHDRSFFGEDRLHELLVDLRNAPAQDVANTIVEEAVSFQHGFPRDDIAVVVLKR